MRVPIVHIDEGHRGREGIMEAYLFKTAPISARHHCDNRSRGRITIDARRHRDRLRARA